MVYVAVSPCVPLHGRAPWTGPGKVRTTLRFTREETLALIELRRINQAKWGTKVFSRDMWGVVGQELEEKGGGCWPHRDPKQLSHRWRAVAKLVCCFLFLYSRLTP